MIRKGRQGSLHGWYSVLHGQSISCILFRSLVWLCMVQFWACMVKGLSCMQIFVLKIIVGPAISFASSLLLVPSVSPHDCMAHASSTFLRVTRGLQQMALGLPVLRELAICLWFVLLVCWCICFPQLSLAPVVIGFLK
jgi:hypothetical protein